MSEQVAIERVAKAIHETGIQVVATERTPWPMRSVTAAAIQEYNAYLRERAKDDDVLEAGGKEILWACDMDASPESRMQEAKDEAADVFTAMLDAMIGKENHDDRG